MKVVKPRFELVTNIVVSSGGGGTFAVFQMKFIVRVYTKALVVGETRERRGNPRVRRTAMIIKSFGMVSFL